MDTATSTEVRPAWAQQLLRVPAGQRVFQQGDVCGHPWRVASGLLRLERSDRNGTLPVMLAEPGDWLGADAVLGQPQPWSAVALVDATLWVPDSLWLAQQRDQVLAEAWLQIPARTHALAQLRSGRVQARLQSLLQLLKRPEIGGERATRDPRAVLPPLRVIADLIDAKHETVCRALGELLPRAEPANAAGALALAA
ncbi:MAG: Crp/Fnr family transcriptional regulator [Tepidimonas sp.]|uniref:Crp/Fnr family transcriptional regulator n=1 Tax=Tepidimonas sp. TaxID=2002775 RepID=UPI004054E4CA